MYSGESIRKALEFLSTHYNDINVNNNISIVNESNEYKRISQEYKFISMKQSVFKNVEFDQCIFENVACTGSSFERVNFNNTILTGNSFANCDFFQVSINGDGKEFLANNFSQSSFESCDLNSVVLFRSGALNSIFHNCKIVDTIFRGSTIEGTKFSRCNLVRCDFGRVNVDYTMFVGNNYNEVTFPFYQLAYIIGMVDMLNSTTAKIFVYVGDNRKCLNEYRQQLDNLKLYYLDKSELFPVCNICLAQNDIEEAKLYLIQGIEAAISVRNFRMISNLCRLACYHGIIDSKIRYKINKAMDQFIQSEHIPESQLNYYITYIGKIQTMLKEGASQTVVVNYKITTNTCKKDPRGVKYINRLIADLNSNIAQIDNVNGYNITISNYSPFEITVGIITICGVVSEVGKSFFQIISKYKAHKKNKAKEKIKFQEQQKRQEEQMQLQTDLGSQYIRTAVEKTKEEILRLQRDYTGKALDKQIVAVTQSLQTDLEDFYLKQIMYFKLSNPINIK